MPAKVMKDMKIENDPRGIPENARGTLVSRLNHPVTLSYKGEGMIIPPRGKAVGIYKNQLGRIPKGVIFVPNG